MTLQGTHYKFSAHTHTYISKCLIGDFVVFFRFIEWVGCCCGGGGGGGYNVKRDRGEDAQVGEGPFCKDVYFKHPARTKACEALSRFPSSMPLYSGYSSLLLHLFLFILL